MSKRFWVVLAVATFVAITAFVATAAAIVVVEGSGYSVIYDGRGRCVFAASDAALPSNIVCQEGAVLYRTDTDAWYSMTSGSWAAATFTSVTLASPVFSGTATGTYTLGGTPTISAPTITSPVVTGNASSGILVSKRCTITEDATNTSYTCTITIPALAVIEDIQVIGRVLWDGTSASMDVGDTADPNGYFDTINLKATDLVIGEMLSTKSSTLWGGQEGAYLVAATGQRGPTTSNFSTSYVAGSDITFVVTEGAADGTAGRTDCVVIYSTPQTVAVTN